jgi:AcrR family transcriptional regulator
LASRTRRARQRQAPLSRDAILAAAIELADADGLESLTMRRLASSLGVEAMSLYNHVASKDELLDGMADLVASEIEVPDRALDWKTAIRRSAISAHQVFMRHRWASGLLESRTNLGPARLRYVDAVIGVLSGAGFPLPTVGFAFMALDSHTYGFTLQELSWPFDADHAPEMAATMVDTVPADRYPNLAAMAEMAATSPGSFPLRFDFGLDLMLDGLERLRDEDAPGSD